MMVNSYIGLLKKDKILTAKTIHEIEKCLLDK